MNNKYGYTLIEILVVLLIISIVTSVGLLAISHNQNKKIENIANELTQMLSLAQEQALLQPATIGLTVGAHSIKFSRLQLDADKKSQWLPLAEDGLGPRILPDEVVLTVQTQAKANAVDAPSIVIAANGDITPFIIYLSKKDGKPLFTVQVAADGGISQQAVGL